MKLSRDWIYKNLKPTYIDHQILVSKQELAKWNLKISEPYYSVEFLPYKEFKNIPQKIDTPTRRRIKSLTVISYSQIKKQFKSVADHKDSGDFLGDMINSMTKDGIKSDPLKYKLANKEGYTIELNVKGAEYAPMCPISDMINRASVHVAYTYKQFDALVAGGISRALALVYTLSPYVWVSEETFYPYWKRFVNIDANESEWKIIETMEQWQSFTRREGLSLFECLIHRNADEYVLTLKDTSKWLQQQVNDKILKYAEKVGADIRANKTRIAIRYSNIKEYIFLEKPELVTTRFSKEMVKAVIIPL